MEDRHSYLPSENMLSLIKKRKTPEKWTDEIITVAELMKSDEEILPQ